MVPPEGEAMAAARALTVRDELAPPVTRAVTSVPMLVVGSAIDRSEPASIKQKASPIACSGIAASVPARPRMRRANLKRPPPSGVTSANWISSLPISARFEPADIASSSQLVSHSSLFQYVPEQRDDVKVYFADLVQNRQRLQD